MESDFEAKVRRKALELCKDSEECVDASHDKCRADLVAEIHYVLGAGRFTDFVAELLADDIADEMEESAIDYDDLRGNVRKYSTLNKERDNDED